LKATRDAGGIHVVVSDEVGVPNTLCAQRQGWRVVVNKDIFKARKEVWLGCVWFENIAVCESMCYRAVLLVVH
jgi:hypothetical protein